MISRTHSSRLFISCLLALSFLLVLHPAGFAALPQVHAQAITSQTKIAVNPTAIGGLSFVAGSSVTFDVNVTSAPAMNSFSVSIQYNPKVLQAVGIDFTSSGTYVLGQSAAAIFECIDGVSLIGGSCTSLDDIGVVTLYATVLGTTTIAPTNGPLFNVTFNVIHSGFSEIHLLTAQVIGCNSAGICGQRVASLNFDGYFTDINCAGTLCTPPAASVSYSPSLVFTGEPIVFDASKSKATNLGATIVSYSWAWGGGEGSNTTTASAITHTFTIQGDHIITLAVTDSYGIVEFSSLDIMVFGPLELFAISPNLASLIIPPGATETIQLSIVNLNGVTESIQLTPSTPTGLSATLNPTTISGSGSAQLNLTAMASAIPGIYLVNVTGATNELTRTVMITVTLPAPPDFSISPAQSTTIKCKARSTCNTAITITPQDGFSGTVTFTASASDGLTCNTPSPVSGAGTTILRCSAVRPGEYTVTVTGSSGGLSHQTGTITYHVAAPRAQHHHDGDDHEQRVNHESSSLPVLQADQLRDRRPDAALPGQARSPF